MTSRGRTTRTTTPPCGQTGCYYPDSAGNLRWCMLWKYWRHTCSWTADQGALPDSPEAEPTRPSNRQTYPTKTPEPDTTEPDITEPETPGPETPEPEPIELETPASEEVDAAHDIDDQQETKAPPDDHQDVPATPPDPSGKDSTLTPTTKTAPDPPGPEPSNTGPLPKPAATQIPFVLT